MNLRKVVEMLTCFFADPRPAETHPALALGPDPVGLILDQQRLTQPWVLTL